MPDLGIIEEGGRVFKKFSNLHQSTSCSDVTLVLGDTKLVAHRFVLGANSTVFEKLLFGTDFAEHNQREVKVDAPVEAFKILLQYMYTGSLVLQEFDVVDVADFCELCHRYEIEELEEKIANYLCVAVDAESAVEVLKIAKVLDIKRLQELCWNLIEMNIEGYFENALDLSYDILAKLVGERERRVSEVNLFKLVDKSLKLENFCTEEQKDSLLSKIDLNKINTVDLFKVVKPANCFDVEKIYGTVENRAIEDAQKIYQGMEIECKATVNDEKASEIFFTTGSKFKSFNIKNIIEDNIMIVDLGNIYSFNHLKLNLQPKTNEAFLNFSIEASKNEIDWKQIIDYSKIDCSDIQLLYFAAVTARFIKICFKKSPEEEEEEEEGEAEEEEEEEEEEEFTCTSFNISFEKSPPKAFNGFTIPEENVANLDQAYANIQNSNKEFVCEFNLLNGKFDDEGLETPCTAQVIDHGVLIIFFRQPYILSSCRFRLWDFDGRKYSFKVETTLNDTNYDLISDKSDEQVDGWQVIKFSPRPIRKFQITGISATIGNELRLVHFEAPSQV